MNGRGTAGEAAGRVRIVEVGLRDGLPNEKQLVPTATKLEPSRRMVDCAERIGRQLGRAPQSRVARAVLARRVAGCFNSFLQ